MIAMYKEEILKTDILIIGGGTAGCQAAIHIKEKSSNTNVLIIEKANIKRSGCLAAGVNAINAYLTETETSESYAEYIKKENHGVSRYDLSFSIGEKLNEMTEKLESYGVKILKDENGKYVARAKRSIRINGENIKPLLAKKVEELKIPVINNCISIDYIIENNQIKGIYAIDLRNSIFYTIYAKAVICATGGAAGIYKANNSGAAKNKMWYPPFNTGAGLAMGIRSGAEMTSFEMRFIALRTKDTISPTGTIAQGVKAKQINSKYENYMDKYTTRTTDYRLYATVMENINGNGPCYLDTRNIDEEKILDLKKAYLNMSPSILLKMKDENIDLKNNLIEIEGSEPYIVGGHGIAGYWIDKNRRTNIKGLYAVGDVAGGSSKKYVTGAMAEGEIAADNALEYIKNINNIEESQNNNKKSIFNKIENIKNSNNELDIIEMHEYLKNIMDKYAGGISTNYKYNETSLNKAKLLIKNLEKNVDKVKIDTNYELQLYFELIDKITIAKVLIEHLLYRKETRWRCYQENIDYNHLDNENWKLFVNSKYENGELKIFTKPLDGEVMKWQ